ncbi:hypothetical protein [Nostoc sp. DedSLP04]|uniref:hypothetical protein n=1 Tax=Nostoc sp. DedSLP04 TaxID=3075401 RepID=UPI002AD4488D|nr:hypothetical protein [Nostoc sp. DedSLP04]
MIGEKAIAEVVQTERSPLSCVQTTLWFSTTLSKRFGVAINSYQLSVHIDFYPIRQSPPLLKSGR